MKNNRRYKTMKLNEAIFLRIRELANSHGLSVYKLAKNSGVPRSTVATMRINKSVGTASIYGICEYLEMTLCDFFRSPLFDRENLMD